MLFKAPPVEVPKPDAKDHAGAAKPSTGRARAPADSRRVSDPMVRLFARGAQRAARQPSPERIERATITRFARERGLPDGLRRAVALVGRRPRGASGRRSGTSSTCEADGRTSACSASREMPGAEWFPGARLNYAEHVFRGKDDDARRDPPRLRAARARRVDLGRAARRRPRAIARRPARARRRRGRPRRRLHAEHPRDDRRVPGDARRSARSGRRAAPEFGARSVVDRFAQIEPKVLLAVDGYRYGGKDFDRRDVVERLARRDAVARAHGRAAVPRLRLDRRHAGWDELARRARRRARVRAAAVRPPAVGALLARARPGCRRRSCTARAASCSSTSRRCTCTSTRRPATASSGSRRPAG